MAKVSLLSQKRKALFLAWWACVISCWVQVHASRPGATSAPKGHAKSTLQCRDESGKPVDWFYVLKYPDGAAYAYMDSRTIEGRHPQFRRSPYVLTSLKDGAVARTLQQIYGQDDTVGYMAYNDEWPDAHKHGTGAHAKGVLGFQGKTGFWLVHSAPMFPNFVAKGYDGLQPTEFKYGQSMLCVSLAMAGLNTAAAQVAVGHPWVYSQYLPDALNASLPAVRAIIDAGNHKKRNATDVGIRVKDVHTLRGQVFTAFYKTPKWGKFLYEDAVEPHYGAGMLWETWMNGVNPTPTFCAHQDGRDYDSVNIRYVKVDGTEWKETKDHSKWGVSNTRGKYVTCVGDINRQMGMNARGGGTVCAVNTKVWEAFAATVETRDNCTSVQTA